MRVLYANLTATVQVNGFLSKEFQIRNGVKQGDALSCGLFVLAIDPLLRNLNSNVHIEGVSIPVNPMEVQVIKVLSYADDITIISRNPFLQEIFTEYERFSLISGLVLNADKTEVFNTSQSPVRTSRVVYLGKQFELGRVDKIRLCGMWLATDEEEEYKLNVCNRIDDMEAIVLSWGRRRLTLNGRMVLAKIFLLSQIVFPAQIVLIKNKEVKRIEKLIYGFVNGSRSLYGPERISRANLKAPRVMGGLNGIDVESFIQAIAVKQFVKAAQSHKTLGPIQIANVLHKGGAGWTAREVLRLNCRLFAAAFSMPDLSQIAAISAIPLGILLTPGVRAAQIASEELIGTLGELQQSYHSARARTRINIILRAVPKPFSALIRASLLQQVPAKISWLTAESIADADRLTTKFLKQMLVSKKYPELKVDIKKIYKRADWPPPNRTNELDESLANLWEIKHPTLRAVRLKIQYKDVYCNERRHRFGLTNSPLCVVCGQVETVEHQLFSCTNATRLWDLYRRLTNCSVSSLFDVLVCSKNSAYEIVKTNILKALIQIDRSKDKSERELISQCIFLLTIEARTNSKCSTSLMNLVNEIRQI